MDITIEFDYKEISLDCALDKVINISEDVFFIYKDIRLSLPKKLNKK